MKLHNLILTIVAIATTFFALRANAQVDGWTYQATPGITFTQMSFTDSTAAHLTYSGIFEWQGTSTADTVWWTRQVKPFKFVDPSLIAYQVWFASQPAYQDGRYIVQLHHGDTTISEASWHWIYTGDGWSANGPMAFNGTLDSVDAITFVFYYGPNTSNFTPQRVWFDYFKVRFDIIYDFGDGGSISGNVFFDANNDSTYSTGEYGLDNWVVHLVLDDGQGGLLVDSVYTDSAGAFEFSGPNVGQGTYFVCAAQKQCWQQTWPANPDTHHVTISLTNLDTVVSFGEYANGVGQYPYLSRWNLVALPRFTCLIGVSQLFPHALSQAYWYDAFGGSGYQATTGFQFSKGYWVKLNGARTVVMVGDSIAESYLQLFAGWNLIGAITAPTLASQVTTEPPNIISSQFFGYDGGYIDADTLMPGQGYWVKAETAGVLAIVYSGQPVTVAKRSLEIRLNTLTITDQLGRGQTLYFGEHVADVERFDLPPLPPSGSFDVRFASQRLADAIGNGARKGIEIQGASYPLVVTWNIVDGATYTINNQTITGTGSKQLTNEAITLSLSPSTGLGVPTEFQLGQNYPNPFNPTTTIKFSVPNKEHVTLKVFNVLGQEVATLVEGAKEAGTHEVTWNAAVMPSGVYFYRLHAGNFTGVRKLVLMK